LLFGVFVVLAIIVVVVDFDSVFKAEGPGAAVFLEWLFCGSSVTATARYRDSLALG